MSAALFSPGCGFRTEHEMTGNSPRPPGAVSTALLWVLMTLGIAINVSSQIAGVSDWLAVPAGLLGLWSAALLIFKYLRQRRT
jgi:hypothetical protein